MINKDNILELIELIEAYERTNYIKSPLEHRAYEFHKQLLKEWQN